MWRRDTTDTLVFSDWRSSSWRDAETTCTSSITAAGLSEIVNGCVAGTVTIDVRDRKAGRNHLDGVFAAGQRRDLERAIAAAFDDALERGARLADDHRRAWNYRAAGIANDSRQA